MLFSSELPLSSLIPLCRTLRHSLGAGLMLREVFRQQAARGPAPVRPVAGRVYACLDRGDSLGAALEQERAHFPPLFVALAKVGEETGNLPEVFGELEKYYTLQLRLRRQLRSQSMLPVIQFVAAILVIAVTLFLLGAIGQSRGTEGTGGISGPGAAVRFVAFVGSGLGLLFVGFLVIRRLVRERSTQELLLRLPVIGPCLEALALARFALALRLTLDTGMPVAKAVRLALEATGSPAYVARSGAIESALRRGEGLTPALTAGRIFGAPFLSMVEVAEESGSVPEMMGHQMDHYFDEAQRRLKALLNMASGALWLLYACFLIVAIFRLARIYLGALGA